MWIAPLASVLTGLIVARDAGPIPIPEPAAPLLDDAPRPEAATTYVVPPPAPRDRPWLRGALFVPRVAAAALLAPVRFALRTEERYHVKAKARELFWNDAHTIGVYPIAR